MLKLSVPGARGLHAIKLRAVLPNGQPAAFWNQTVQVGKEPKTVVLPLAFNDPAGAWTLTFTDLFSAETDHHAEARQFSDLPLVAYRMADALGRPYAATASGGDWAFIKEQNLPGLVRGWIALSYAAGHCFMVPHRQWCYTPQKGTHWYQGPPEKLASLYRFVRGQPELFDDFRSHADLGIPLARRLRSLEKTANTLNW